MANIDVLDMGGQKVSEIELSDAVFGIEPNTVAMHQMVVNYLANNRQGTQSALTRAEVQDRVPHVLPSGHTAVSYLLPSPDATDSQ